MKPRVVAVVNQKGGVGKTTTAINLGATLAAYERRTLLVDLDPQGNCTTGLGQDVAADAATTYDVLTGRVAIAEAVRDTEFPHLAVVPATPDLAGAEVELVGMVGREFRLREAMAGLAGFRYVLVDCPPSLGLLTVNALAAADALLVPIQCEYYAMEGVSKLLRTLDEVRRFLNPELAIDGVVLTMYDDRTNLAQQVAEEVRSVFGELVFQTVVPRNVRLAEAPSFGRPIHAYDLRSKGAQAYLQLGREYLERTEVVFG
ncbi:MAG TPA: ParA family protein [Methylomirabilota bacterium]|nr:ParA family protein [Methylomirabilota bacterium]